jgi:hypothetical protein
MERMQLAGTRMREQRADMRATRTDRRNRRLRADVEALRSELDRERDDREHLLDAIKEGPMHTSTSGALKLVIVGGVAYLLGAKAGRARYEQIVSWARRMKDQGGRRVQQMREDAPDDAFASITHGGHETPATTGGLDVKTRSGTSPTASDGPVSGMPSSTSTAGKGGTGSTASTTAG